MYLYIVAEDKKIRDLAIKSLDLSRFDKVKEVVVNGRNTLSSYARSVRIIAKENGVPYKILVIFNSEHMTDNQIHISTNEYEEACITKNTSKEMRIYGYSENKKHVETTNNIQDFLNK